MAPRMKWPKTKYKYNPLVYDKKTNPRIMSPKSKFTFGKYEGQTLEDVQAEDSKYVKFCTKMGYIYPLPDEPKDFKLEEDS